MVYGQALLRDVCAPSLSPASRLNRRSCTFWLGGQYVLVLSQIAPERDPQLGCTETFFLSSGLLGHGRVSATLILAERLDGRLAWPGQILSFASLVRPF
jgi:hypothetical protein